MKKIVVYGALDKAGYDILDQADATYSSVEAFDKEKLHNELQDADGVILRYHPFSGDAIDQAPSLKIISRVGVGCDNIDMDAARARKIDVAITGDVSSKAVAEQTLALMLASAKQIVRHDEAVRNNQFSLRESVDAIELDEKSVLIVGFGRIGKRTAHLCNAFDMKVHIFDPFVTDDSVTKRGYVYEDNLDVAIRSADFIALHIPGGEGNDGLFDQERINKMKHGAVIVNTSRGTLFDEAALADAVSKGRIFAAGTDVFSQEPVTEKNPLISEKRIVLSPHNSAMTKECMQRLCKVAAQNLIEYLFGERENVQLVGTKTSGKLPN